MTRPKTKDSQKKHEQKRPPKSPARGGKGTPKDSVTGRFTAHRDGYGFVAVEDGPDHFIPAAYVGGALDGDLVVTGPLPPRHGRPPAHQIVKIAERRTQSVRGQVVAEGGQFWVVPLNYRLPDVAVDVERSACAFQPGDWVVMELTDFPLDHNMAPAGRVLEVIPEGDSPEGIIDMILQERQMPLGFSDEALDEAQAFSEADIGIDEPARTDLTALNLVTIDGEDARDFDDAVFLEGSAAKGYRLVVAIADVAHYVRPGSALEAEAQRKGTSVYFPTRVEPMLPERLSNELCSLQPGKPRMAMVCDMNLDAAGSQTGHRIYNALIRSHARLTYNQVQQVFDGAEGGAAVPEALSSGKTRAMLVKMRALAAAMRERRHRRGALQFVLPEARFTIDQQGLPVDVRKVYPSEATQLIEQFMLEANETVAAHCAQAKLPILYRVHDPPPGDTRLKLKEVLWNFGLDVKAGQEDESGWLNEIIAAAKGHVDQDQIEMILLRTLSQACYRHTNDGHFGLAATHYAHFTSPIRRYPDLQVHRALKAHLKKGRKAVPGLQPLAEIGEQVSTLERNATEAERQVIRLFQVLVMEARLGEVFSGTVSAVSRNGLIIKLDSPYVEGFLPTNQLLDDRYRFDARENVFRGMRRGNRLAIGSKLQVQLARCDRLAREIEFAWVTAPLPHDRRRKGR